ncbi:MAG: redoxin domain-containing protein [Deltaproteobacteria bacterium]|nr:redoxin domain-containing protein [Deltaproteobacteria bacterium]
MRTQFRPWVLASLGSIAVILSLFLSCTESKQPDISKKTADDSAPDFTLKDVNGRKFTLGNYRGRPVLLIFITTWCPTCRAEIPHYKNIHATYSSRGLEVVNIDIQESKEKVSQFVSKYQIPYKMLLDENGDVAGIYNIVGVPSMVLIDKEGKILSRKYHTMDTILETLLPR